MKNLQLLRIRNCIESFRFMNTIQKQFLYKNNFKSFADDKKKKEEVKVQPFISRPDLELSHSITRISKMKHNPDFDRNLYIEAITWLTRPIKKIGTYTYKKEPVRKYTIPIEFIHRALEK